MVNTSIEVRSEGLRGQMGFTLIELLIAMTLFSMMLLIIVSGFLSVMRLRNHALASNMTQDSARTAMNEMVRAIRDSAGIVPGSLSPVGGPLGSVCLLQTGGQMQQYFVAGGVLTRANNCGTPYVSPVAITNNIVKITQFELKQENTSPDPLVKPEMLITLTVVSNNGTATVAPDGTATCGGSNDSLPFCAVTKLSSGAVPR